MEKTIIKNKEKGIVERILFEKARFGFKATPAFYDAVNIKRKRWAMIQRNEISPTIDELLAICGFFEVELKNYI